VTIMKSKPMLIGMLLLLAICLSGCVEQKDDETYRCTVDDGVLYLSSGHYDMLIDEMYGDTGLSGDYAIHEGIVCLRRVLIGDLLQFKQDGRDLIDPDGDRWVRD